MIKTLPANEVRLSSHLTCRPGGGELLLDFSTVYSDGTVRRLCTAIDGESVRDWLQVLRFGGSCGTTSGKLHLRKTITMTSLKFEGTCFKPDEEYLSEDEEQALRILLKNSLEENKMRTEVG